MRAFALVGLANCWTGSSSAPAPPVASTTATAQLAAPSLDLRFGVRGRAVFDIGPGEHELHAVVALADGSALVAGHAFFDKRDACVARFTRDGVLDPHFGSGGVARVGTSEAFVRAVAVDRKARILVAGYFYAPGEAENLLLARLLPDGTLDASFGTRGVVTADYGKSDDRPSAVLPLADGNIAVVGIHGTRAGSEYEMYTARFDDRGRQLHVTFVDLLPGREFVSRAKLDRDGSIVVAGYAVGDAGGFVARLAPDGTLDRTFGVKLVPELAGGSVWALAIDARGRILLGGQTATDRAVAVRFTADGARDRTWGDGGIAGGAEHAGDQLYELLPQADGGAIAVGFRGLASNAKTLVARFAENGAARWRVGDTAGDFTFAAAADLRGGVIAVGMTSPRDEIRGLVVRYR